MADNVFRESLPPADHKGTRPGRSTTAFYLSSTVKSQAWGEDSFESIDTLESLLASKRFIDEVNELQRIKRSGGNRLFWSSGLLMLAGISSAALFFFSVTFIFRSISSIKKESSIHHSLPETVAPSPAPLPFTDDKSPVHHESVEKNAPGPDQTTTLTEKPSDKNTGSDLSRKISTGGDDAVKFMVPERKESVTVRQAAPVAAKVRSPASSPPVRQDDASYASVFQPGDEPYEESDFITQFYEPVNASKNAGRSSSRTTSYKRASAHQRTEERPSSRKNRTGMIASIVRSFGGSFIRLLEHNGDYYKMQLSLPDEKVETFKNTLAKETIIASFSVSTVSSSQNTSTIILEMHSR